MNVLSLFAGIGGLDLGLEWAGLTVVGQVEINPFCRRVLAKHWPEVPRHDDVRTCVDWWHSQPRPAVHVVAGGFPCQPVSLAGRGKAQDDERWLWPAMHATIRDLRPRYALLENVPGLLSRGMGDVLADLAEIGYDAEWDCIPASAVGALHRRDRVFIIAYPHDRPSRSEQPRQAGPGGHGKARAVADADRETRQPIPRDAVGGTGGTPIREWPAEPRRCGSDVADPHGPRRGPWGGMGRPWPAPVRDSWWAVEPDVGGALDGFSAWLDGSRWLDESHKLCSAYANATGRSSAEALREVRDTVRTEDNWRSIGRRWGLSPQEVLLTYLRELPPRCRLADLPLAGAEAPQAGVRGVRADGRPTRAPRRRRAGEQQPGQSSDVVHALSQLLARHAEQAWTVYRRSDACPALNWESGIARVAYGIPGRVERLRGLGNAVVPQVAEHVGRIVMAMAA